MLLFLVFLHSVLLANFGISHGSAQICDMVKQIVNDTQIIWPMAGSSSVSIPPCLNENLEFIYRKCRNGKWEPEPECFQIMKTKEPLCPDGYSSVESICYKIIPEGPFSNDCPFPNELPHFEFKDKLQSITSDFIWYPIKRNDDIYYGEYYYVEKSHRYGTVFDSEIENFERIKEKRCIAGDAEGTLKFVNCEESFKKVCAYKVPIFETDGICKIKFPDKECVQLFSGNTNDCVCILEEAHKGRNEFCEKLAEFEEPYKNQIRGAIGDKYCWFGLEKVGFKYIWSTTMKNIEYAFWSTAITSFTPKYGNIYKDGWLLSSDESSSSKRCALCEEKITYSMKPKMEIHAKDNRTIILTISGDFKIFNNDKNHVCFFEAGLNQMQNKIETKEINNTGTKEYYFNIGKEGPGFYWCEGFSYPNLENVKSNKMLVFSNIFGDEFVAHITVSYDPETNPLNTKFFQKIRDFILTKMNLPYVTGLRKFKSFDLDEDERKITFLIHISTEPFKTNRIHIYYEIQKRLLAAVLDLGGIVDGFSSSNFCPNETRNFLTWPVTPAGKIAFPKESCMQNDGFLINRQCVGDFLMGAKWGPIRGTCEYEVPVSEVTQDLNNLLESNETTDIIVENLKNITEKSEEFDYTDIFLVGKILQKISDGVPDILNVSSVISNIMDVDRKTLIESQLHLNATDGILKTYDDILQRRVLSRKKSYEFIATKNLACLIVNVAKTNIIGLVLSFKDNKLVLNPITTDTNIEEILQKDFKAAVIINKKLAYQIKKHLIITVFFQDSLFNPNSDIERTVENTIFGVLLPRISKKEKFQAPLSIIYKRHKSKKLQRFCAHWQFSNNNLSYQSKSNWLESGVIDHKNTLVSCDFWHVTHFGLLVGTKSSIGDFEVLTIITSTNCAISAFGLFMIFVTCVLFKNWRIKPSNQILINFSLAISIQIGALYFSSLVFEEDVDETVCIIMGVVLHYSVLAEFCWMLILGFLQFKRLVVVYIDNTKWTVFRYCMVGWLMPTIPVLVLLVLSPKNYSENYYLCYPTRFGFYLFLLLPIFLILIINFSVFAIIAYKICKNGSQCFGSTSGDFLRQLRMIILLFFMLGLTWIFGLLSYLNRNAVFLYLFCFLATLQGFMLFMFFIVFNKSTRRFYKNLIITSNLGYSNKM